MLNIRFNYYLDKSNSYNTTIFLYVRRGKECVKFTTDINIDSRDWNLKKQSIKYTNPDYSLLNSKLLLLLNELQLKFIELQKRHPNYSLKDLKIMVFNKDNFKSKSKFKISKANKNSNIIRKEKKVGSNTFHNCFELYLKYLGENKSIGIRKKLNTVFNKIIEFEKLRGDNLSFKNINIKFFDEFSYFLINSNVLSNNTINKYLDNIKMFMNWAYKRGYHNETHYQLVVKLKKYENEIIFLTEDELNLLEELDLSNTPELMKYRDMFLFGCYTGQRFSDLSTININEINNGIWVKTQQKSSGGTTVRIPLSAKAISIINSYPNGFNVKTNQVYNRNIKEFCKMAKICKLTVKFKMIGKKRTEEWLPKYELVTSHTARKTFITLSLFKGMNIEAIKKISGHTTDTEFRKYLKVQDSWVVDDFNKAWD